MSELLLKLAIGLGTKLITETFLARILIHTLRAWADTSDSAWDDLVVDAMAEALGVDSKALKSK
jgi:hypothetical protein